MLHPHFFAMVERACARGAQLKIETNAPLPRSPANAARLKELGVKAVQVSLDGASRATFGRMRVRGEFDRVLDGVRNLRDAGVPIEINFSPARFNMHEVDAVVDLAYELGAYSFYTGRTMYTGNAVKAWRHLEVTDEQYVAFFDALRAKTEEYRGRMRVYFHEAGLLEELRYRIQHPAALLIVLPNGLVKLINALPFICGDFRRDSARRDLGQFPQRVARPAGRTASSTISPPTPARRERCTNGSISERAPTDRPRRGRSPWQRLLRVCALVRYRFFLYAGLLPYLLGAAWAYALGRRIRRHALPQRPRRRRARGRRRRGLQRVFRLAHGHRPGLQPADLPPMTDAVLLARRRRVRRRARRRRPPDGARRLADPRLRAPRRRGGDLLRGTADPLGLPRPRRAGHRAVVRAVDGAGQPLPAHPAAVVAGAGRVAGARAA